MRVLIIRDTHDNKVKMRVMKKKKIKNVFTPNHKVLDFMTKESSVFKLLSLWFDLLRCMLTFNEEEPDGF